MHLSSELYSEDIHSILELTQNSDDNSYSPDVIPTLAINLSDNPNYSIHEDLTANNSENMNNNVPFILNFINNEIGFSIQNVNAMCDISKSTKSLSDPGYIGHKGIGFKSVFKLTERPEIHSNYFHFCFDSRKDVLGYVIPANLSSPNQWNPSSHMTLIKLPLTLKEKNTDEDLKNICEHINDISSTILLFLHRLRCLDMSISSDSGSKIAGWSRRKYMRKDDIENSIVQIFVEECNHQSEEEYSRIITWLVSQNRFNIISEDSKTTTTEISVALPLDDFLTRRESIFNRFDELNSTLLVSDFSKKWLNIVHVFQKFSNAPSHQGTFY
jgi:hypothetical protein